MLALNPLSASALRQFVFPMLVAAAGLVSTPAAAAEITMEPFPETGTWRYPFSLNDGSAMPPQKVRLTGEIVPGDAEKLRELVQKGLAALYEADGRGDEPQPGENMVVVSLDSPGGDFRTGIEIGNVIRELSMPTLVEREAACLSACAVAFMSGYLLQVESDPERLRMVEAGGKLGFHRPFFVNVEGFDLSNFEGLTQAEIDEVISFEYATFYDLANEVIQEMLAADPRAWSNELLLQMLLATQDGAGGHTFVYLDKVGQAIEWGIHVSGVAVPETRNRYHHNLEVWTLCFNSAFDGMESIDWQDADDFKDADVVRQSIKAESASEWAYLYDVEIWGLTGEGCEVSYSNDGTHARSGGVSVGLLEGRGLIHLYKASTSIADIAAPPGVAAPTPENLLARLERSRYGRCRVYRGAALIDNQPCARATERDDIAGTSREVYTWPSGNRTIIAEANGIGTINGDRMDFEFRQEHEAYCQKNLISGNTFCYDVQ